MRICILTDEEVKDFDPAPYMQALIGRWLR